jgi:2-polyprenyl-6-methoxyphenol hydroxylase-like FAD-dependent oxidoreductase
MHDTNILIVGAGPTGLAAALFLAELGHKARIVDKAERPSPFSKAFGVNARSMELLAPSGVTERFLSYGRKMEVLNLRHGDRVLAELRLRDVDHPYPFMCVQGQTASERMLADALSARGINVERGVELLSVRNEGGLAVAELKTRSGRETVSARAILGADGASSSTRKALGISFDGVAYDKPWKLFDIELTGPLDPDAGHIFLLPTGGMFVVRHETNLWRVLGNADDLLDSLPRGTEKGRIEWQSEFTIANRVAGEFSRAAVFLAGDAAHIHAGIGARGMNLGIEDAYVFAELYNRGELHRFDAVRRPVVRKVVGQIERAMAVPRANTIPGRLVRTFPSMVKVVVPIVRSKVQPWVLGLDHEIGLRSR